jgi:hypothetical protein
MVPAMLYNGGVVQADRRKGEERSGPFSGFHGGGLPAEAEAGRRGTAPTLVHSSKRRVTAGFIPAGALLWFLPLRAYPP